MTLDLPPMDAFRKRIPITPELIREQLVDGPLGSLELYQRLYAIGARMTFLGMAGHFEDLVAAGDLAREPVLRKAGSRMLPEWRYSLTEQGRQTALAERPDGRGRIMEIYDPTDPLMRREMRARDTPATSPEDAAS